MGYQASGADEQLAFLARKSGARDVTARKIWRWRRAGLIPTPKRHGLGQHKGTMSEYPPGTVERVVEVAEILKQTRYLSNALLILFVRGRDVSIEQVRRVVLARLGLVDAMLDELAGPEPLEDPASLSELAERIAPSLLRDRRLRVGPTLRSALKTRGVRSREANLTAAIEWTLVFLGDDAAIEDPAPEFLTAFGFGNTDRLPAERERMIRGAGTRESVVHAFASAPTEHFDLARRAAFIEIEARNRIVEAIRGSPQYAEYAEEHTQLHRRRIPSQAKQDLANLTPILGCLLLLEGPGESALREFLTGRVLLSDLTAAWFRGGMPEMERVADRFEEADYEVVI